MIFFADFILIDRFQLKINKEALVDIVQCSRNLQVAAVLLTVDLVVFYKKISGSSQSIEFRKLAFIK